MFSPFSYANLVKCYMEEFLSSKSYFPINDEKKNPWHGIPSTAFSNGVNVLIFYFDWKEYYFGFFYYNEIDLEENKKKSVFEINYLTEKDLYNLHNVKSPSLDELTNVRKYEKTLVLENQLLFLKKIL